MVTDRRRLLPDATLDAQRVALVAQAAAAAAAGADVLQIRERDLTARELGELVSDILEAVADSPLLVLVNDRLDIALSAGAHGVHLPGSGLLPSDVRRIAPPGFIVGQSIHGDDLIGAGADFAIFGTVFPTTSKSAGHATAGIGGLSSAARRASVPVLAIGGITEANVDRIAAVCAGIAAIGWFSSTDERKLVEAVRRARDAFDTISPLI